MKITQLKSLMPALQQALSQQGASIVISERYKISVEGNNFVTIAPAQSSHKIIFIDGGNAEVIGGVNYSLQLIRRASLVYQDNKQVSNTKDEFFSLTTIVPKKTLFFETQTTPHTLSIPVFSIHDRSLAPQGRVPTVSLIGEITRRFSELDLASTMVDECQEGDAIILDGLISPHFTGEEVVVEKLLTRDRILISRVPSLPYNAPLLTSTTGRRSFSLQDPSIKKGYPDTL